MDKINIFLDAAMCIFWMITYTLVFVGTIKYKYPLISPITQAIIAPLEILMAVFSVIGNFILDYISIAYIYWTIIEIAIFIVILRNGFDKKKYIIPYMGLIVFFVAVIFYVMIFKEQYVFSLYFFTLVGECIWLKYILNKNYPLKPISLAVFVSKFIADFLAIPVYIGKSGFIIDMICILLPVLDFVFIIIYFGGKKEARHAL